MPYTALRKKLFRDILSRKAQFVVLCITVMLGVMIYSTLTMATRNLKASYQYAYDELHYADFTVYLEIAPESIVKQLEKIENIKHVEPRLTANIGIEVSSDRQIAGLALGINSSRRLTVNDIEILDGSYFSANDSDVCIIEQHFAKAYGIRVNDNVTLLINGSKVDLRVIGIATSPEFLILVSGYEVSSGYTFGVIFVPLRFLQEQLGLNGLINEICVIVKDRKLIDETIDDAREILKPYNVIRIVKGVDQPCYKYLEWDIEGFYEVAYLFSSLVLLVALIEIYTMLKRLIISQRREIGILKAVGYSKKRIVFHYLSYALIIGVIGSLLGILASMIMSEAVTRFYTETLGIPFCIIILHPDVFLISTVLGLLTCIIGAVIPCLNTLKLRPIEVMRPYISSLMIKGRVPLVEKIIDRIRPISTFAKISVRNLVRNRVRTASTILGIALSLMLVVSTYGLMDSFYVTIEKEYNQYELWDVKARFNVMKPIDDLEAIANWEGVLKLEPFIIAGIKIRYHGKEIDCLLIGLQPDSTLRKINIISGTGLKENKIVITEDLANKLALSIGDEVTLSTYLKNHTIAVSGICREPLLFRTCFAPLDMVQEIIEIGDKANGIYLRVTPDKTMLIRKKLYQIPGIQRVYVKEESRIDWLNLIREFTVFSYVMWVMSMIIAFSIIFNTSTINVMERKYEHATLMILGTKPSKISRILLLETLIMALPAMILGIFLGYMTARYFLEVFTTTLAEQMIILELYIYPQSYTLTIISFLATIIIAHTIVSRQTRKINLGKIVKESAV